MNTYARFLQGNRHKDREEPCQDRAFAFNDNIVRAITVADGVGSDKYSDQGAMLATTILTRIMAKHFDECFADPETYRIGFCRSAKHFFEKYAVDTGIGDLHLLSTTYSVFVVKDTRWVCFVAGDSPAYIVYTDDIVERIEGNGVNFANVCVPVNSSRAEECSKIKTGTIDKLKRVVLVTDGADLYNLKENRKFLLDESPWNSKEDMDKLIEFFRKERSINGDDLAIASINF